MQHQVTWFHIAKIMFCVDWYIYILITVAVIKYNILTLMHRLYGVINNYAHYNYQHYNYQHLIIINNMIIYK